MISLIWEEYLKTYNEQKRLEAYQRNRVLVKPKTSKIAVALYLTMGFILVFGVIIGLFAFASIKIWISIPILTVYLAVVTETYGRLVAIKIVECYQHYASEETRRKCKCIPSCSEYAILCLKKYELIYAIRRIRKRLLVTCKGYDYIIDDP